MKRVIFVLYFLPSLLVAEVKIGAITSLLYEYYQEPISIKDDNIAISKPLISLTPQFIWREGRNMLLLNIELFGTLGSLDGSFGKDGKLSGQLKSDSFYKAYIKNSGFYLKFGKYSADLPYSFGLGTDSGSGEIGLESEKIEFFYSLIFYNWFNQLSEDGSYNYKNDRYYDDNIVINNIGINFYSIGLKLRAPIESKTDNLLSSLFPSISHKLELPFFELSSFAGVSIRDNFYNLGIREELKLKYGIFNTDILFAYLTPGKDRERGYSFTSVNNRDIEFHYGSHFNYLYQQGANIYGLTTLGIRQQLSLHNLNLWLSGSSHFSINNYVAEGRENTFIGTIFSLGFKSYNLWAENTMFEIYFSLLKPEGFSIIDGTQERDLGIQLVIKLQHIIF